MNHDPSRVESLLAAHEKPGPFLEMEAGFARLKPEEAGERIGHCKLLPQIGEGGFGTVWMAEQERPVRRRVALKIIKLGMDTKEVIARFEQERQTLAMMDHPNMLGPEHRHTLWAMVALAGSYASAGRHDEALKLREQVSNSAARSSAPRTPTRSVRCNLSRNPTSRGQVVRNLQQPLWRSRREELNRTHRQ